MVKAGRARVGVTFRVLIQNSVWLARRTHEPYVGIVLGYIVCGQLRDICLQDWSNASDGVYSVLINHECSRDEPSDVDGSCVRRRGPHSGPSRTRRIPRLLRWIDMPRAEALLFAAISIARLPEGGTMRSTYSSVEFKCAVARRRRRGHDGVRRSVGQR